MRKIKEVTAPSLYYRAPEGEDIVGKLAYVSKYTGFLGLSCGIIDAQIISQPKGYIETIARMGFYVFPLVGIGAAFVSTTYIATNLRKKNDSWNYALGGAAAGSVLGAWRKSASLGALAAVCFAAAGALKKEAVDNGLEIFPVNKVSPSRTLGSDHYDFTLTKEIPGNWTTGRE